MSPLRILQVTPYYEHAWAYGGIPRVVAALARGLAERGHAVTVCTTDVADERSRLSAGRESPSSPPVEVRVFPNLSNRLAYGLQLYTPRGLGRFLEGHAGGFDVAHIHGCHHLPGVVAARQLRRAGVPYLLTPNGTAPRIERRRAAKWLFDTTVGRRVTPGAALVLAVSEAERRQLTALGIAPNRLRLLPNPLVLDEFDPPCDRGRLRTRWKLGNGPLVLYLGMLTPRKGLGTLVEAFAAVAGEGVAGAQLVLAGNDRGMVPELRRRLQRAGCAQQATLTGTLRGRERLEALADADVLAYPSRDEAFGLVPLEALLCGTPVVVADDHGCGEVIAAVGGGLRVPPGDVRALAEALRAVLTDAVQWRRRAADAAHEVRRRFASARVCAGLEELYKEVLAAGSARVA